MSKEFNPRQIREERARQAIAEARRFIAQAEMYIKSDADGYGPSPVHAAMRRASMDLTRSLSMLRRNVFKENQR